MPKRCLLALVLSVISTVYSEELFTEAQLKDFAAQLGSDNFDERQRAERVLTEAGEKAQTALEAIKDSKDLETKVRANKLLKDIYGSQRRRKDWAILQQDVGLVFGCKDYSWRAPQTKDSDASEIDSRALLQWLAKNQEEDGHWDSVKHGAQQNADIEQTSLALLAFLGAGHTEKVGEYKNNVKRAVEWLSKHINEDGAVLYDGEKEPRGLAQALAGIALCEASGMANLKTTNELAQRVTDFSCEKFQSVKDEHRWGFGAAPRSNTPNLLISTLFVMHLKSAKVAGRKVPAESFDGLIGFLDAVETKPKETGGDFPGASEYSFIPGGKTSYRATMMALLCRQFLGWKRDDLFKTAEKAAEDYGDPAAASSDDLTNYFGVLVMFQQGPPLWHPYNDAIRNSADDSLIKSGKNAGSWNPRGEWSGAGRVFSTAVRTLSLEVYYRYQMLKQ